MKWKLSFPKSPMPMYYFATLCGLAPITLKNGRFYPGTFLDKLYSLSFGVSYLCIAALFYLRSTVYVTNNAALSSFRSLFIVFYVCTTFAMTSLTSITLVLMCDKVTNVLNELCSLNIELIRFGIQEDSRNIFRRIFESTVVINGLIFAITCISSIFTGHLSIVWISSKVKDIVRANTILIFTCIMICIKDRFVLVNEKLANVFEKIKQRRSPRQRNRSTVFAFSDHLRAVRKMHYDELTDLERIRKIEYLHFMLCDLVEDTTSVFGVPILTIVMQSFMSWLTNSYWVYNELLNLSNGRAGYLIASPGGSIAIHLMYIVIDLTIFSILAHVCETTCKQGNNTKVVLTKGWNKFKPVDLKNEIKMFSLQLQHYWLEISACGFFHLNYSNVGKISGAVITYFIVMMQFDAP